MDPPALAATLHALLAGALLLPPTTAMGATLPLLARLVTDRRGTAGDRVGALYAANTAGAVLGTALAGLVLLPQVGLAVTTGCAAAGNLALGLAAIALDPRFPPLVPRDDLEPVDPDDAPDTAPVRTWDLALLAGIAALANEVAWTRLVALVLGGTTYAFTAMLLAVLVGIAVGAGSAASSPTTPCAGGAPAACWRGSRACSSAWRASARCCSSCGRCCRSCSSGCSTRWAARSTPPCSARRSAARCWRCSRRRA
ncbi:MAG: hypothetical protein R3F59_04955 [Myxococcota bacterium]